LELAAGRLDALRLQLFAAAELDCQPMLTFALPQLAATISLAAKCFDALCAACAPSPPSLLPENVLVARQCWLVALASLLSAWRHRLVRLGGSDAARSKEAVECLSAHLQLAAQSRQVSQRCLESGCCLFC
jgi:hypothetical protein